MNHKNYVQEHCQKYKHDLPKYITKRIGGDDHKPEWQSEVVMFDMMFRGNAGTKIDAEQMVAQKLSNYIKSLTKPNVQNKQSVIQEGIKQKVKSVYDIDFSKYKIIVLIDAENCDADVSDFGKYETYCFIFFCAKNTSKKKCFEFQNNYANCFVIISDSVGKDAADHLLTFTAGKIEVLTKNKGISYFVLTKDHYGEYMEKFMEHTKFICSIADAFN